MMPEPPRGFYKSKKSRSPVITKKKSGSKLRSPEVQKSRSPVITKKKSGSKLRSPEVQKSGSSVITIRGEK
jgi:hypothetical protein